ncbi:peroxiredoxin family protein [Bacillus sp. FJAT-27225]|uniref:peroxiredoxin family protein n=1 Tax=Bacillus sp. FJAT-27225 TaxID=1743144 RepID=UPI0009818DE3|nr:redoxin domain-containing protein [Bacillus sp. FJAT-27225]
MQVIQIGSLSILLKWALLGIAILIGLLFLKLWMRKAETELTKRVFDSLSNSLIVGFVLWKLSLLLFEPSLVKESLLSLLYFTGGSKGLMLAIPVSILFFFIQGRKQNVPALVMVQSAFMFSFAVISSYYLLAFFILEPRNMAHLLLGLYALAILGISFIKPKSLFAKKGIITSVLILFVLISMSVNGALSEDSVDQAAQVSTEDVKTGVNKGDLAPDFQVQTLDGKSIRLSELRGKKVILNFWASWCPPCKAEMPHMQDFYSGTENKDIEILAVNLTDTERNSGHIKEFAKEYRLTFPVLLDEDGEVGRTYQAVTIPTSYFIDSAGIIRQKVVGPMDKEMMSELSQSMK